MTFTQNIKVQICMEKLEKKQGHLAHYDGMSHIISSTLHL